MLRISVVIPVYNGAGTLEELARRLRETLAECCDGFELVFVDDASSDESWRVPKRLREADRAHVKLLQHARNFGQHKAILSGLAHASGKLVVTMDDDLQHPPEQIATLLRAIGERDDCDVVFGAYTVKRHAGWRNLGSVVVNRVTRRVFSIPPELQLTSFRIMRRWVADELVAMTTQTPRLNHMIAALTLRLGNVPVRHEPRRPRRLWIENWINPEPWSRSSSCTTPPPRARENSPLSWNGATVWSWIAWKPSNVADINCVLQLPAVRQSCYWSSCSLPHG